MPTRPDLAQLGVNAGKKARLHRILHQHGLRNGTALIFGRNVWQRGHDESLRFVAQLREILAKYPSGPRPL